MDFPGTPLPSATASSSLELQREIRVLRMIINLALVALVILSASLLLYFWRQVSLLRRQVELSSRSASQVLKSYRENVEAQAVAFERQLREFARTNADFQVQISKYFPPGNEAQFSTTANPNAAPAPAAPKK